MKKIQIVFLFSLALLVAACHPKSTILNHKELPELAEDEKVVFMDVSQQLPSNITKVGDLKFKDSKFSSKSDFYTHILEAKKIARKNGANVVKAVEKDSDGTTVYEFELYKFDDDLDKLPKFVIDIKPLAKDSMYKHVYLKECGLASTNTLKRWCTELSVQRAILQHYSFPEIKDSSTFKNQETYSLTFDIAANGSIENSKITGGTNETVNQAILAALTAANLVFEIKQAPSAGATYTCFVKLRAFDFQSAEFGPAGDHPQAPQEAMEDDFLKSIRTNTYK